MWSDASFYLSLRDIKKIITFPFYKDKINSEQDKKTIMKQTVIYFLCIVLLCCNQENPENKIEKNISSMKENTILSDFNNSGKSIYKFQEEKEEESHYIILTKINGHHIGKYYGSEKWGEYDVCFFVADMKDLIINGNGNIQFAILDRTLFAVSFFSMGEEPPQDTSIGISKSVLKYSGTISNGNIKLSCISQNNDCWREEFIFKKIVPQKFTLLDSMLTGASKIMFDPWTHYRLVIGLDSIARAKNFPVHLLRKIVVGNLCQDRGNIVPPYIDYYHFDNSSFSAGIQYIRKQWDLIKKTNDIYDTASLKAFGKILHAMQDFYSHSNWVEEHIRINRKIPAWDPMRDWLPPNIYSGTFFDLWQDYRTNCEQNNKIAHHCLNKDSPGSWEGSMIDTLHSDRKNYYELAFETAKLSTEELFNQYCLLPKRQISAIP